MTQTSTNFFAQEEYLAFDRESGDRHEYYKGEVIDMSATRVNHSKIQMNFIREIGSFLKEKSADVFGSDLRIHIPANMFYTYPDAMIVCDEPALLDEESDTVLNPAVIVEIMSSSTQDYDRGEKLKLYCSIESLQEYILIDSLSVKVEHYIKLPNGTWLSQEMNMISDSVVIASIDFALPLAELYYGVTL